MGAMSKSVSVGSGEDAISSDSAATKLRVGNQNTAIDDTGIRALASRGVIDITGRARGAVGDRSETPGSSRLGSQGPIRQLVGLLPV